MSTLNNQELFQYLLSQWQPHKQLSRPPLIRIPLWNQDSCHIAIGNDWGPPIPYPPYDHRDGHQNHGYVNLKEHPKAISEIPELDGWPDLQKFIEIINAPDSPIESGGCEKGFFPTEGEAGATTVYLGSYVDVFYSNTPLNDNAENLLFLASRLIPPIEECAKWWSEVNIDLCRFKYIPNTELPWGLELHVINRGRTEDEARKYWGETLRRLGDVVAQLPSNFKWI